MYSPTRKRFGQHWLKSEAILNQIIAAARLCQDDAVLEIGPGTGILTRRLVESVSSLVAVEIDRDLCIKLRKLLGDRENFSLIEADILQLDLNNYPHLNKVVANIPYNITGPILEKLLGTITNPTGQNYQLIVLLIQKEVADRLVAQPGSKTFGALSVRIQYLADCQLVCRVPAKAFQPPPKVDSAVVSLSPRPFPIVANNPKHLGTILQLGFANRRKMLRNNLKSLIDGDHLSQLLQEFNLNPQARAEELSLTNWIHLSNHLQTD
ncbi:16S rRNA (adenine(1518)-N(6)/adenine(1519)-N(6))-dimethyltransferase RsmA [Gloeocapsa sp. PCC 73106]|uniref:16S rRNA (adenine(1518)-N(6)/adenine(1519)-N(6))- dimethyltransferase RsmA n=1 Tax=Gloeocapsa sp. PCC 73106 TaxID=102232 RepID=UPI0002ACA0C6|nr:16S rRNA (adenine(1518)-N(6)/adenine(1519)-N(6))-dimethyltransferase RsmA [Gloeocapsa sp. PCC 73106]ELR97728.1 dimethyladenosine transferase [Gloeocapsa sp. PCC 73106]